MKFDDLFIEFEHKLRLIADPSTALVLVFEYNDWIIWVNGFSVDCLVAFFPIVGEEDGLFVWDVATSNPIMFFEFVFKHN